MYSKHAEQYAKAVQDNVFNANFERPSLQSMLGDLHGKSVLDLGCGSGVYASYLLEKGASSVTCIDASQAMIYIVNKTFGGKINAYTQDLSLGLPKEEPNSADVIICPLVVHYIEDLSQFFIEIHRVLKAGGYMIFSTHNPVLDFTLSPSGNYFKREMITEEWNTIGEPVEVSFYRRPLSETFNAITNSGLVVSEFSEGKVTEKLKNISPTHYEQFSTKPQFIFIKCQRKS